MPPPGPLVLRSSYPIRKKGGSFYCLVWVLVSPSIPTPTSWPHPPVSQISSLPASFLSPSALLLPLPSEKAHPCFKFSFSGRGLYLRAALSKMLMALLRLLPKGPMSSMLLPQFLSPSALWLHWPSGRFPSPVQRFPLPMLSKAFSCFSSFLWPLRHLLRTSVGFVLGPFPSPSLDSHHTSSCMSSTCWQYSQFCFYLESFPNVGLLPGCLHFISEEVSSAVLHDPNFSCIPYIKSFLHM